MPRQRISDEWPEFGDEQLLDLRLADLPVRIEGTLADRIGLLRSELDDRGLRLPIHFFLADEWFTPDGATSIAIPFYLAHPRLEKLEETQMFEVEGGEHEWAMRILRHEAGHALDNAFRLRLKRQRREIFGNPSTPYPEFYTPRPHSKSFVLHLDSAGTPRATRMRTSPRRSRSGSHRTASGARAMPAGRPSKSSNTWTR